MDNNYQNSQGQYGAPTWQQQPQPPQMPQMPQPTQPSKKARPYAENTWIAGLKALGYFGVYFGITFAVQFVIAVFWVIGLMMQGIGIQEMQERILKLTMDNALLLTIVADVIVLAAYAVIVAFRKNPRSRQQNRALVNPLPIKRALYLFITGVFLNFGVSLALGLLTQILPSSLVDDLASGQEVYNAGGLLIYIIGGVILAPIVEELTLRGFVAGRLSRGMPVWIAVILSSCLFGVLHGAVLQMVYAGLLGVLLGFVFFRENTLFASIAVHFGFNLASLVAYCAEMFGFADSSVFNIGYTALCFISVPIAALMIVLYFTLLKKTKRADPVEVAHTATNI